MAGIEGIGKGVIDWKVLLDSVTDAGNVNGANGPQQPANLVLTAQDKQTLLNILTTPALDTPAAGQGDAATKLESLIKKLQDGKTYNFTPEQTKTFVATLNNVLTKLNQATNGKLQAAGASGASGAAGTAAPASSSKVLFDIYELLVLLIQCAQEQKNAQRDLRQAETQAMVASIQNQADEQRSAALTGLIAGSLICGLQAVAAGYAAYKTVSNVRAESAMATEAGVRQASTELTQAQEQLKTDMANLKTFETEHPAPAQDAELNQEQQQIEQQRTTLKEKVTQSKQNVAQKNMALKIARGGMMNSDEYTKLKISEARMKGFSDISMALGNLGQTVVRGAVDIQQAEAMGKAAQQKKAEEDLAQTRDLMESFQNIVDQVGKLAQAVLQAENDSMRSAIQA